MKRKQPTKAQRLRLLPKPVVVFLLNHERVLAEVTELAKAHIAELLRVEPSQVHAQIELAKGGRIIPMFNVEMPGAGAWEQQYIQKGIAEVWMGWARRELTERLAGLADERVIWGHGSHKDSSDPSPEKADEEKTGETPST